MKLILAFLFGLPAWWQRESDSPPPPDPTEPALETPASPTHNPGLTFVGAGSFTTSRLERVLRRLQVRCQAPLDITEADDAAFFIREFYHEQGFAEARVDYEYDRAARRATLFIDEGPVTWLGRVSFSGESTLPQDRLQDIVRQSLRISSRSFTSRLRFVESALWTAADDLCTVYARMGYLRAEVDFFSEEGSHPRTRDVVFYINEGPRFVVREIAFLGDHPPELEDTIRGLIGTPWTEDEGVLLVGRVSRTLHTLGFHRAQVEIAPQLDENSGAVDVGLIVQTGPLYRFGALHVTGQKRTFPAAILNRLGLRPGQIYDRSALQAGERRLWFSGAFSEVRTDLIEQEGDVLDVAIEVEEGKARQIRGTLGYSQWEQLFVNLSYTDRNFLGTLREFSIEGKYSALGYGGYIQLSDPMVFNSETKASLLGFYLRQEMPAYDASFLGFALGLSRQFSPPNLTGYKLQYIWRSVFDVEVFGEGAATVGDEFNYTVGMIAWGQTLDRRNDPLAPMSGFFLDYQLGLASEALGGSLNFFQPEAQATYYLPLRQITPERPFVPFLVFNHRVGWIAPFAGTDEIPTPERFFMGGPNSVRSFQLDGMGPRDADGDPIGGELFWLLTGEFQMPIWGPFYGVTFVDAGNLALTPADYDWDDTRVALGVGARLYTPIGAVRIDYGYNLIRGQGDPIGAVLFGFGFTF